MRSPGERCDEGGGGLLGQVYRWSIVFIRSIAAIATLGVQRVGTGSMANAAERLRQRTFEVRDKSVKQPVVYAGTLIKVGTRGGRFWCRVKWVRWDGALVVTVDNDLIKLPWKCGDEIVVQREHVLETCDPTDLTFVGLLAASRSVPEATMQWREVRVAEGLSAQEKPRTVFVLPGPS